MACNLKIQTEYALRDLHARELMRLGWYRQFKDLHNIQILREKKANHQAFLRDLLRKRNIQPFWYARLYYILGHILGYVTAYLPERWSKRIEHTLEYWILLRYEKYFSLLSLQRNMRSMIEAIQLRKLTHNEPGFDVLQTLEQFISHQQQLIKEFYTTYISKNNVQEFKP